MNHKMKLVAAVVAGLCAVSTQAGQLAGNPSTIYAAETITNTANVPVPTFTYQTSEPINGPVAGTNTIYVVFTSSAGTWKAATGTAGAAPAAVAVGAAPTAKLLAASSGSNLQAVALDGTLIAGPVVIGGVTYTSSSVAAPNNTLVYSFTIPTNAIYGLGSNFFVGTLNAAGTVATDRIGFLTGLSASLGLGAFDDCATFTGGSVTVTATIGNTTGAALDTIAPFAPTKTLLSSALGIKADIVASADTAKIDAIANSSKTFTRTVPLGGAAIPVALASVNFTDAVPGTTDLAVAAYSVANLSVAGASTAKYTVTGNFTGQTADAGRFFASASATCATSIASFNNVVFNTAKTSVTFNLPFATLVPVSGTAHYVCYSPVATTAATLVPSAFTVTASLADTATLTDFNFAKLSAASVCPASTFTSVLNASKVIVRNYSPAAANASGWNQFTRIINSGSQDAKVTGYYQYGDGSVGVETLIANTVKKGGNITLSNTQIEQAIGAPVQPAGVTTNPRLVLLSPTSSMRVQNYIVQPSGAWFEASAGQNQTEEGSTTFTGSQE